MVDFGLDMLPTLYLACEDGKRIDVHHAGEIPRMLPAGLRGPAPVTADDVIERIYRDTTPGGKVESHWHVSPHAAAGVLRRGHASCSGTSRHERKANGWPEFICCPIDEVDPSCKEFGREGLRRGEGRRRADLRHQGPRGARRRRLRPVPGHLVLAALLRALRADRRPEALRVLVLPEPQCRRDQGPPDDVQGRADDLRLRLLAKRLHHAHPLALELDVRAGPASTISAASIPGCGQRMDDDGQVIPAVYWACFREGYDDARYLYTLQQAIVQRQDSTDPGCQAAVRRGRQVLQETWEAIRVQPKYLADGHVALGGVRRRPLAAGGPDRGTAAVSRPPISRSRHRS